MATHHRCTGCLLDKDINLHIEDSETTGLDNDNHSTSSSDATVALGGPEAEGHPDDCIYSNQAKLTALMRDNFTDDAITTRIFVKGLKNVHSLAISIY